MVIHLNKMLLFLLLLLRHQLEPFRKLVGLIKLVKLCQFKKMAVHLSVNLRVIGGIGGASGVVPMVILMSSAEFDWAFVQFASPPNMGSKIAHTKSGMYAQSVQGIT